MEKQQGFWKQVLQGGGAFSPLTPSYEKANRYTKEAIVLFILYAYIFLAYFFGGAVKDLGSILRLLVPFLGSAYCLFLIKTLQTRSKNQIRLGWIISLVMSLLSLYMLIAILVSSSSLIPLLFWLFVTGVTLDLGNFFRKSNN